MKKGLLIVAALAACCLCCWAFVSAVSSSFDVPEEGITFHEVQLVCGAAPDIGCGSRSKPILLDLQKEPTITEAWLNRPGTVVAIVWQDDVEPNVRAVASIFRKHRKSFKTLKDEAYQEQLISFNNEQWYQGADVDQLSMEEAGRIATQIVDQLVADKILSDDKAPDMHADVEKYIQNEFIILEDVSLLNDPAYYAKWEKEIRRIGETYISADKMPDLETYSPYSPPGASCKKGGKACCTEGQKGCCMTSKAST